MNKNYINLNEKFLFIFKHRVAGSLSGNLAFRKVHLLFKEHVDILQKTAQLIREVREGIWEENQLDVLFSEPRNLNKIVEVCEALDSYRFSEKLCDNPIISRNINFQGLLKIYKHLDLGLSNEIRNKFSSQNSIYGPLNPNQTKQIEVKYKSQALIYPGFKDGHKVWTIESFPLEQIKKLIAQVRDQSEKWFIEDNKALNLQNQLIHKETIRLNALLEQHSSLFVLVLDIRLINYFTTHHRISEENFWWGNGPIVIAIRKMLEELPECLYGYTKAERDLRLGINLHCILYFKYTPKFNEQQIITLLKEKLAVLFPNLKNFEVRNWNNVLNKFYSKLAVGCVKKNNKDQIKAFQDWVLNYYFMSDRYLWPEFQVPFEMETSRSYRQGEAIVKEIAAANKKMKSFCQMQKSIHVDEKSTWITSHLSKDANARIQLSQCYNREKQEVLSKSLNYIEIFIETILASTFNAFELKQDQVGMSKRGIQMIEKTMTRIGRQFFSLADHYLQSNQSCPYHHLFRKKINFELIHNFKALASLDNLVLKNLIDVNNHIVELRNFLNIPIEQLGNRSIADYRMYQSQKYKKRYEAITPYVKQLFKQDVKIYHVKLHLNFMDAVITQGEFSKLLTKFFHGAKRAKPLYWMTGYIGFWRENSESEPYAELVFFLDKRSFDQTDQQIFDWIYKNWSTCLDKNYKSKTLWAKTDNSTLILEQKKAKSASIEIYSQPSVLLESDNKPRQKTFLKEIIHELIVDCTFEEKPEKNIPKALIKGSLPKKRQRAVKDKGLNKNDDKET
ncbi:hypothetical protein [Acinetobacter courvalinii]|uniref:Uncharacterized protein n=1 Tax=Acinetobacter courvalinii TaxID=280147 RepID=N9R5T1_9GAMM|nr:hypothetical protein [Acinetobacter courvalinii]ENX37656.1 hypothetical protein F888_02998 [Acinetobacter courvalinii]KAB0658989.1 hypothetical protein F7P77_15105 [Acinetobacter courvalinii]GGH26052.1 hypothetical protein GCM10007354_03180 [Acinetobacter courvalinii]